MARKRIKVEAGSGNVFADLGLHEAKELKLKVRLAVEVNRALEERQLSQEKATKVLGIRQPHVSDLVRYRLDRFSVERLMDFLTRLGKEVQIRIRPRRAGQAREPVQVHHVS
jgi:predicted XRE-type DNA-binding protein